MNLSSSRNFSFSMMSRALKTSKLFALAWNRAYFMICWGWFLVAMLRSEYADYKVVSKIGKIDKYLNNLMRMAFLL